MPKWAPFVIANQGPGMALVSVAFIAVNTSQGALIDEVAVCNQAGFGGMR
jgi:hypothetical protein